jgi:hypothetical protein
LLVIPVDEVLLLSEGRLKVKNGTKIAIPQPGGFPGAG